MYKKHTGNKHKAFTLVELICYIAILVVFVGSVFVFVLLTQKEILSHDRASEQLVRDLLVLDLLKRDLMSSGMNSESWSPDNTIFTKKIVQQTGAFEQQAVRWVCTKNGLLRNFGAYDFQKQEWGARHTDFFTCTITNLVLIPQKSSKNIGASERNMSRITGVLVKYNRGQGAVKVHKNSDKQESFFVRLRNRVIL